MKKLILTITVITTMTVASVSLMLNPAFAQSADTSTPATTAAMPMSDSLYQAFGEKPGLTRLVDDLMVRLLADPRTGPHFKPSNQARVKTQLVAQFCMLTGGPCVYQGADMRSAHRSLDIRKSDFHALVEVLQLSMDAQGIAFATQNKLLALLAPMHREVVTTER